MGPRASDCAHQTGEKIASKSRVRKRSSKHQRTPAWQASASLRPLHNADHLALARVAVEGAENHLTIISDLLKAGEPTNTKELHWRTRAVFWELIGAWDLFMMWANDKYRLGMQASEVDTYGVFSARKDAPGWRLARRVLSEAKASSWYFELREYRNFAHRSFLNMQGMHIQNTGEHLTFLLPARVGQDHIPLVAHLSIYVTSMLKLGAKLDALTRTPHPEDQNVREARPLSRPDSNVGGLAR